MYITSGRIAAGSILAERFLRPDDLLAAAMSRAPNESFILSSDDDEELLAAIAEIEHGDFISVEDLLDSLRNYR